MSDKKQIIKFKAVQVVKQPTKVSFTTRDGQKVTFTGTKAVEKTVAVQFKAKPKK